MSDSMAFDWSMTNGQSSFEQGHSGSDNTNGFYGHGPSSSFSLPAATAGNSMGPAGVANGNITGAGAGASLVSNFDSYDFSTYGQTDPSSFDQTPGAGPSNRPFQQSHWGSDVPPLPQFSIGAFDGGNDSPSDQPWLHDSQWQFQGLPAQNASAPTQAMFVNPADLHGGAVAPVDRKPSPAQLAAVTVPQRPGTADRKPTKAELEATQLASPSRSGIRPGTSPSNGDDSPLASLSQNVPPPIGDVKPSAGSPVLLGRKRSTRSPLRYMLGAPPASPVRKDSSSLDAPVPKPAKPQPPAEVVDMNLINNLTRPDELQRSRPAALFKYLRPMIGPDSNLLPPRFTPTPDQLRQILKQLNTGTTAEWRRLLGDSKNYCETIGIWLRSMYREPQTWAPAIAPLFLFLSKTDMAADLVAEYKISKYAQGIAGKVAKLEPGTVENAEGIAIAYKRYHDYLWNVIIPTNREASGKPASTDAPKKRKSEDAGIATSDRPTKRSPPPATSAARSSSAAPAPAAPAAKAARPGAPSRNLSAPIPKMSASGGSSSATSSFFKPAAAAGTSSGTTTAGRAGSASATAATTSAAARRPVTSAYVPRASTVAGGGAAAAAPAASSGTSSLLNSVMKSLGAPKPGAAPGGMSRPVGGSAFGASPVEDVRASKPNKKGFTVRFREDQLTEVEYFTEEAHELEWPPWFTTEDIAARQKHQMTQDEGMAFKTHLGDDNSAAEPREWYEPFLVDDSPLPAPTPEVLAQEERERGILAVQTAGSVTDPDETGVRIITDSHETRRVSLAVQAAATVTAGGAAGSVDPAPYSAYSTAGAGPAAPALSTINLGDLLSKIGAIPTLTPSAPPPPVAQTSYTYGAPIAQRTYGQPNAQAGGYGQPDAYSQPAAYGALPGSSGWVDPMAAPRHQYAQGFPPAPPHQPSQTQQSWGGRGEIRDRPCRYYQRFGHCNYGDRCMYYHDQP